MATATRLLMLMFGSMFISQIRDILVQKLHLCTMDNVNLHLQVHMTLLLTCFAVPQDSETFRPVDMHHGMEVRLGLSKGPACPSFI